MQNQSDKIQPIDPLKPYTGRFQVHDQIPEKGRDKQEILKELSTMAEEENQRWKNGQVSGTLYHAGDEHLAFLNKVFSKFSHMNTIQFDLCPRHLLRVWQKNGFRICRRVWYMQRKRQAHRPRQLLSTVWQAHPKATNR